MTTPAPGSSSPAVPGGGADALQDALAAEHRAVFGYSVIGPQLSGTDRQRASNDQLAHEQVRDATSVLLAAAGRTPVGPAADYPDVYPAGGGTAALAVAAGLEDTAAAAWRYVYSVAAAAGSAGTALRTLSQQNLTACAVRAARWRAVTDPARAAVPFPGI